MLAIVIIPVNVNPARAGMILMETRDAQVIESKPRASGDDPDETGTVGVAAV